jgi:hypothetical protein
MFLPRAVAATVGTPLRFRFLAPRSRMPRKIRAPKYVVVLALLAAVSAALLVQSPSFRAKVFGRTGAVTSGGGVTPLREDTPQAAPVAGLDSFMAACPLEGRTRRLNVAALNRLKNRAAPARPVDVDSSVTLAAMLRPGDDHGRFDTRRAASIEGWVVKVKSGGDETVNCGAPEERDRDTHLELAADSGDADATHHVIVEVTPRTRAANGEAWSTDSLRHALKNHRVRVTGWLFYDAEHVNAAANTRPTGTRNWRATAWEIHPITRLEVLH